LIGPGTIAFIQQWLPGGEIIRQTCPNAPLDVVQSAGFTTNGAPISGNSNTMPFRVLGRPWHGENNLTPERDVSAGYFATLGARLWRGRYFIDAEDASKPPVAIVNRALVRKYFPGEDALGRQLARPWPSKPIEIVGIVEDIREGPLDVEIPPVLYIPFQQSPDRYFSLVVRTRQEEHALLPALAATMRRIDPGIVTDGGKAAEFYAESVSLVEYLIRKYGADSFAKLCSQIRDGKELNDALRFTYPDSIRSIESLESGWRQYLTDWKQ